EPMDMCVPVKVTVCRLILRGEDHRTSIHWIDADRAVITPPIQGPGLRAATDENRSFIAHCSQRIRRASIRVTNARHDRAGVGDVVANGNAASLIHRSAAHPTKIISWSERTLLEKNRWRRAEGLPGGIPQLIPPHSDAGAAGD